MNIKELLANLKSKTSKEEEKESVKEKGNPNIHRKEDDKTDDKINEYFKKNLLDNIVVADIKHKKELEELEDIKIKRPSEIHQNYFYVLMNDVEEDSEEEDSEEEDKKTKKKSKKKEKNPKIIQEILEGLVLLEPHLEETYFCFKHKEYYYIFNVYKDIEKTKDFEKYSKTLSYYRKINHLTILIETFNDYEKMMFDSEEGIRLLKYDKNFAISYFITQNIQNIKIKIIKWLLFIGLIVGLQFGIDILIEEESVKIGNEKSQIQQKTKVQINNIKKKITQFEKHLKIEEEEKKVELEEKSKINKIYKKYEGWQE